MDPNPNPTDDDDHWFPEDWHHTSFPALPLSNTQGFDIDFRWGSTWLDEQGTPGVVAEHASSDVPMTNWQSLQERNSRIDAEIASTAINPHPHDHPQPQHLPPQPSPTTTTEHPSNKRRSQRQRPAAIETTATAQQVPQPKKSGKQTTARSDRRRSTTQQPSSAATSSSTTPSTSQHPYHRPAHSSRHNQSSRSSLSDAVPASSTTTTTAGSTPTFLHHHHHQPERQPDGTSGLGGGGGGGAPPAVEVKLDSPSARVPHKAVEKKYREGIKAMFRRLSAAIPGLPNTPHYGDNGGNDSDNPGMPAFLQHDGVGGSEAVGRPPQRPTKAGIISRAIEYIHQLERDAADERRRRESAEAENERLRAEVRELRRELGMWRVGSGMFSYGQGAGEGLG
ncbi:uncharacterized protein LTHEOB_7133 [Lasiodiplodia theobromae]|uniref:BHLH domain-containing protein n=1 Tax=Lasiodiplodia theobromae TaxID=45133 RepID=A0A5N5DPT4_9PEZI|nr:uncharacterized protein LTHEOB_7133 [Lasiodiplodia theobromae]KAB2579747.1 hypothetical protein DBV05_g1723 [Lasiodiplodia theobromae]KAF4542879.1 hypothetical protein LTHEOB_7133 [Lasiodiplodia theobromae]